MSITPPLTTKEPVVAKLVPFLCFPERAMVKERQKPTGDMVSVFGCFRDLYLQHVLNGTHGNKGVPAVSAGMRIKSNKPITARMI